MRLWSLASLVSLDLSDCPGLSEGKLVGLRFFPNLEMLNLSLDSLTLASSTHGPTDADSAHLGLLTRLQVLRLNALPRISDAGLLQLQTLSQLTRLEVKHCEYVTPAGVRRGNCACPGVRSSRTNRAAAGGYALDAGR